VPEDAIENYESQRELDRDRKQNMINTRFPSLAEARD
jgi:hypothetical protein